jgi:AraC-type DNA-binding domain-containing proteins
MQRTMLTKPLTPSEPSLSLQRLRLRFVHPPVTAALIAGVSFVSYVMAKLLEGPTALAFSAFGASACGWAWLFARALFVPTSQKSLWPHLAVTVLTVSGAIAVLAPNLDLTSAIAANVYRLSGSAALLLTLIEPFQGYGRHLTQAERRFRILFGTGYALLAGISVLGVWLRPEPIQIASALMGLAGVVAATGFRLAHPLTETTSPARKPATDMERRLAVRLDALLRQEAIFADPDLRIGDVAARLGEPEHRVSRCIRAALGFANFNRLINHHRIQLARHLLATPQERRSILEIALDCGFASIGPFNRAFKAETGMTPRAWRAQRTLRTTADPACPAPGA